MADTFSIFFFLLCAAVLSFILFFKSSKKRCSPYKFPPGPKPWPLIGNLNILNMKFPQRTMCKLAEQYGPVFTFHMARKKYIVLTGYDAVKEALVTQANDFGERGLTSVFHKSKGKGIMFGVGESWKTMRRFTLSTLRDFGMGRSTIEDRIIDEAQQTLDIFAQYKGRPFNPTIHVNSAASNIICVLVFGQRFQYDDPHFLRLQQLVSESTRLAVSPMVQIQRFGDLLPNNLLHETKVDTTFRGYHIPKGTPVIPLLSSVLYDKTQWQTPHKFNPGHFLDAEGRFVKRDAFMPFSAGQRKCIGETLAKMELFLFFTSFLQRFKFQPPPGVQPQDLDLSPCPGVTSSPTPYELCAISH
ncbi:hypothetical protein COCON_G00133440 [Conger conger]|uniref:Cytochrome P450 n=1 Tax=Conger conger TaxID=82655 RepID=A0A9Q1DEB8_CONCO|nr:hypothetical protein COCON_G00133440 [Conger conger]